MNEEMPARRLRILCVCSASHWGGNERWLSLAMAELAKRHEVYLCYRAPELAPRFPQGIEAFRDHSVDCGTSSQSGSSAASSES